MNTRLDRDRGAIRCFPMTAQGTLKLRVYRRGKGEAKGFTWADYRDLILPTHRALSAPLVWVWDNLNIRLAPELAGFAHVGVRRQVPRGFPVFCCRRGRCGPAVTGAVQPLLPAAGLPIRP